MNRKLHLVLATALMVASTFALARLPNAPPPPPPEEIIERLSAELQLSAEQQVSILDVLDAAALDMPDREPGIQGREAHDAWRDAVDAEIEALLSDAQRERFREWRAQRPAPPRSMGARRLGDRD